MVQNGYEEEIDLILIGKALLKKWKLILLVGAIFAVATVSYKVATAPKPMASTIDGGNNDAEREAYEKRIAEIDAEIESVRSDIEAYRTEKQRIEGDIYKLNEEQDQVLEDIKKLKEHKDSSVILNLDPYNTATEIRTYYISTDYQIMPGMLIQNPNPVPDIVSIYTAVATSANADVNEVLHTAQGDDNDKEVSLCSVGISGGESSANDSSGTCITIVTLGSDRNQAGEYMNRAVMAIEEAKETVASKVGDHEIILMNQSSYVGPNYDLKAAQEAFDEKIELRFDELVLKRNDLNVELENMNTSIHNALTYIQTQEKAKGELVEPSPTIVNESGVSEKELIKWVIIGFVVGTLLACLYLGLVYTSSGTIKSEVEFLGRYGIQIIGYGGDEKSLDVTAATVNGLMLDDDALVIISSLGRTACEPLAARIKDKYPKTVITVAGDVLSDADGVDSLGNAKKAVIVEKTDMSVNTNVAREVQLITDIGISIIGFVMQ